MNQTCRGRHVEEIAAAMGQSVTTINRDLAYIQKRADYGINTWISQKIVWEVEKCVNTLSILNREVFEIKEKATDTRDKVYCCELIKEIAKEKLELLSQKTLLRTALIEERKKITKLENRSRSLGKSGRPVSRPEREQPTSEEEQRLQQESALETEQPITESTKEKAIEPNG